MFTFHFFFMSVINLLCVFVIAVAFVYITKLIDLWMESWSRECFILRVINLFICEISANIAIAMPFLIFFYIIIGCVILII
jgi:hypothetical protein